MWIIFFAFGLIVGSFLNVVVYRLNLAETIWGRSHCPKCRSKIRWYDNIPLLSFVFLAAKCRDCREKISWHYPLVELSAGVVFALTGKYFFQLSDPESWILTIFYLAVFSLLIVIFSYDLRYMEIPMLALWIAVGWTVIFYLFFDWRDFRPAADVWQFRIFSGALAGLAAFLFFFALSAGSRERWMGMGDAYVALLAGLLAGWPAILGVLFCAFSAGAVFGVVLLAARKKTMKSQVPFAPFLALGVLAAIFIPKMFPSLKYYLMLFY